MNTRSTLKLLLPALGVLVPILTGVLTAQTPQGATCIDYSRDPAGCQPSTFDTPLAQMPSVRVNKEGKVDPMSSEADARLGASMLEKELHLFRNFEHLHWVLTVPSTRDAATGAWRGGDLDGAGDGRGLGIAGNCIYIGHGNGAGFTRPVDIFKIQANPEKQPPVKVGEIPAMVAGNQGFDDRELRALVYRNSEGQDRLLLVRNAGTNTIGRMETYAADMNTCLPVFKSEVHDFNGPSHEFFLWHDPVNPNRILVYMAMFAGGGLPDPENPGLRIPDAIVLAITDENTGEVLPKPKMIAGFSLQDTGGPPPNERPDATGLFADGRFADYSGVKNLLGEAGNFQNRQNNELHSLTISDDGERVYVAGGTAGFYILNSEAIAHHRDAELEAGTAGCNKRSTVANVNGVLDGTKLLSIASDCLHMIVNDDPGLRSYLLSAAPAQAKAQRYLVLATRSRFDVHPPFNSNPTGIHSAVFVPERPAKVKDNTKNRPAFVWLSDENFGCPLMNARVMSVDVESAPMMIGAFAIPDNQIEECLDQAINEPNGQPRRRVPQQNHNPTVFKNLVFTTWYGHGLRAIDISQPQMPREVGYALPVPQGVARTYPVFRDGLIYWVDNDTGLHVARYTGPRANELPGPGSGVYEGNATSPHR